MKFVYYLYRMIFISFFLVMLHVVVCGAPSIDLTLPLGDFRSSVRTVLFKGHVEDIDSLTLNGHPVEVYENRFYVKVLLEPFQTNEFTLRGRSVSNETVQLVRDIDFFPKEYI